MLKRKLKIDFTDFWPDFSKEDNLFINFLKNHFDLELSASPDIVFFSCYSFDYLKYNCHRIFYTGENTQPDHRLCDFSLSFNWDNMKGKNMRLPLFRFNGALETLTENKYLQPVESIPKKFCCKVVSNAGCKERNDFFEALSGYKKIDSGGRYKNNVGGPVANKEDFVKDYKFVLSFENSSTPGYTTEKIIDPFFKRNIPVYWGNEVVNKDFNTKRFINVPDYASFDKAIEAIIKIDQDDNLYQQYVTEPVFKGNVFPEHLQWQYLESKFIAGIHNILNQKPVATSNMLYSKINKQSMKLKSRLLQKPIWYC